MVFQPLFADQPEIRERLVKTFREMNFLVPGDVPLKRFIDSFIQNDETLNVDWASQIKVFYSSIIFQDLWNNEKRKMTRYPTEQETEFLNSKLSQTLKSKIALSDLSRKIMERLEIKKNRWQKVQMVTFYTSYILGITTSRV